MPDPLLRGLLEFARRLRSIEAERIELGVLVQEAFLRRHRNDRAWTGQHHGLAKLAVPIAERERLALEAGDAELRPADIGVHARIVGLVGARRRLRDTAHGE